VYVTFAKILHKVEAYLAKTVDCRIRRMPCYFFLCYFVVYKPIRIETAANIFTTEVIKKAASDFELQLLFV